MPKCGVSKHGGTMRIGPLSLFGVVENSDKGTSLHSWLNKNVNIAIT